jgi:hypothetical protein
VKFWDLGLGIGFVLVCLECYVSALFCDGLECFVMLKN